MNEIIFKIQSEEQFWASAINQAQAIDRRDVRGDVIPTHTFTSLEQMNRTLTAKRWEILRALMGQDPMSIRELARRIGRDVKAVHGDVRTLILRGLVDQTEAGVSFPYDAVHVDLMVYGKAAEAHAS